MRSMRAIYYLLFIIEFRARLWDAARTSVGKKYSLEALAAELLEGQHKRSIKGPALSLFSLDLVRDSY